MTGKGFVKVRGGVRAVVLLTALAAIACGGLALQLGQDANFDQQNYHLYAPFALLNDRVLFDIFPAFEGPTYYNPFPFMPFYWLAWYTPPVLISVLFAAAHALVFAPLYLLARTVPPPPFRRMMIASVPLAAFGLGGAIAIAETGTTFIDNLMAGLMLAGVAAAALTMPRLARGDLPRTVLRAATIGLPAGLAAGFKLTGAGFAVALALAFLVVPRAWPARLALVAGAGAGIVFGVLIAGGPWFAIMWVKTGNPVFPYFNQIFHSPLAALESYRYDVWIPQTIKDALLFPILVVSGRAVAAEVPFFDLRIPALYSLAIVAACVAIVRRRLPLNPAARFTLAFAAIGYGIWLITFAIWRYLVPVEILAPVLIATLVGVIIPAARVPNVAASVTVVILAIVVLTTRPADWGRIPWGHDLYDVRLPPIPRPAQSLVVMAGSAPTAFLIPFFPGRIPFIRLDGFSNEVWDTSFGLFRIGSERVRAHEGDIYLLYRSDHESRAHDVAAHFSLILDSAACRLVENLLQPVGGPSGSIRLCLLRRTAANGGEGAR